MFYRELLNMNESGAKTSTEDAEDSINLTSIVPIKTILASGLSSFILFAIAIPGFICPPVPAAEIITFIINFL